MEETYSNASEPVPSEPAEQPDATPLDHIVDDLEPKVAWGEWAVDEMKKGRSPDDLLVELTADGWSEDDAAELVEASRRSTRHLRGVVTRDDVARRSASRYYQATSVNGLSAFRFVSVFWLAAVAVRQVLNSLAYVLRSRPAPKTEYPGSPIEPAPIEPAAPVHADAQPTPGTHNDASAEDHPEEPGTPREKT